MDDKVGRGFHKQPGNNQYTKLSETVLEREEIETEEVQLLSPMVFSQPINGHLSSNTNNDTSVLEIDNGGVTPLTKAQLSQVNGITCMNYHILAVV